MRAAVAAIVVAVLSGCGPPPLTELVIIVRSDLPMDHVTVRVTNPERELKVDSRVDAPAFPLTLVLLRDHAPYGPVHVEVAGYGVGSVQRSATTSFVEGVRVQLEVLLESACRCHPCDTGMTCRAGACQSDAVDPALLPIFRPLPDAGATPFDGGPRDAGTMPDAGRADAGPRDAGAADAALDSGRDGGAVDAGLRDGGALDTGVRDGGPVDAGPRDAGGSAFDAGAASGGCGCQSEACCSAADCAPGLSCRMGVCQTCTATTPSVLGGYNLAVVQSITGSGGTLDIVGTNIGATGTRSGNLGVSGGITASGHAVTTTRFLTVSAAGDTITFTDSTGAMSSIRLAGATVSGSVTFADCGTCTNGGLSSITATGDRLRLGDVPGTVGDIAIAPGETCR